MRHKRRGAPQAQTNGAATGPPLSTALLHRLAPDQLRGFARNATKEIERLRTQIKQCQTTIEHLQQMLTLIAKLDTPRVRAKPPDRLSHAEVVADILGGAGRPMSLGELLTAMADRGALIAGKTDRVRRSNLIITLGRSPLVRRVGRGLYALAEWRQSA